MRGIDQNTSERVSTRIAGGMTAAVIGFLFIGPCLASAPHALISIDGVGKAAFKQVVVGASKPASAGTSMKATGSCNFTLQGGFGKSAALQKWATSNKAVGALATKPDGSLTVVGDEPAMSAGQYRLHGVQITSFSEKANANAQHVRLDTMIVECEKMEKAK